MSFRQKCLFLFLFLGQFTVAQHILMIEDQTKTGFKLVVNGFIQNETALNKLNIQGIPEGEQELALLLEDGQSYRRKLPELEKGFHRYVIYRDYKGNVRFRYRGLADELVQSALMIDYSEKNPWIDFNRDIIAEVDTNSQFEDWKNEQALIDSIQQVEAAAVVQLPQKDSLQDAIDSAAIAQIPSAVDSSLQLTITEAIDSGSQEVIANTPEENKADAFEVFKTQWNASNFEFDKLQIAMNFLAVHQASESETVFMLKGLKYDQSRLNLLQEAIAKAPQLKDSKEALLACLDYDLSKEQAKSYFEE